MMENITQYIENNFKDRDKSKESAYLCCGVQYMDASGFDIRNYLNSLGVDRLHNLRNVCKDDFFYHNAYSDFNIYLIENTLIVIEGRGKGSDESLEDVYLYDYNEEFQTKFKNLKQMKMKEVDDEISKLVNIWNSINNISDEEIRYRVIAGHYWNKKVYANNEIYIKISVDGEEGNRKYTITDHDRNILEKLNPLIVHEIYQNREIVTNGTINLYEYLYKNPVYNREYFIAKKTV